MGIYSHGVDLRQVSFARRREGYYTLLIFELFLYFVFGLSSWVSMNDESMIIFILYITTAFSLII